MKRRSSDPNMPLGEPFVMNAPSNVFYLQMVTNHIRLPLRMAFYNISFHDLYSSIQDRLEGCPPLEKEAGRYALFQVVSQNNTLLYRLLLRNVSNNGPLATRPYVVLHITKPQTPLANLQLIKEILNGISEEFRDVGTMRFLRNTDVQAELEPPQAEASDKDEERGDGPTERIRIRFEVFKRIKNEHPTWSQARVAQEACKELGEIVTDSTVRNAYRSMGATWERGDRVR